RVGVLEVGRTVQRDDRLPRARTTVDYEGAARSRADDGVLVCLDGRQHVLHPGGTTAAEARDEGRLVVEGGVALETLRREHLVPVVGDASPAGDLGPSVAATGGQAHR